MGTKHARGTMRALGMAALLLLVLVPSAQPRAPRPALSSAPPDPPALTTTRALPAGLAPVLAASLADPTDAYAARTLAAPVSGFRAANPANHLGIAFLPSGITISDDPAGSTPSRWGMRLAAVGDGEAPLPVSDVPPTLNGTRVEYRRGGMAEWYLNSPLGLEQGFTLDTPPVGARTGELVLSVAVTDATVAEDGVGGITLAPAAGGQVRYGQLTAADATGRALPARLTVSAGSIRIAVADAGAVYPVVVDPLVQQGNKLTGTGETAGGQFGAAVALSGDGNTALVGTSLDASNAGAAFVFTRSGTTWTQQGSKLTGTGETAGGQFGYSVALNGDGSTALIGAHVDNGNVGSAFVFTRSGGVWSQQGNKLTGTGEAGGGQFGYSVALSSDGSTALIGASGDSNFVGAAFVFTRSGGVWSQQGSKLTGGGETGQGSFGSAVALSGDGSTALIGASGDSSIVGAAFVFTRSGTTWSQQGSKLTGGGETGQGQFGSAVALSSDGNTAFIGALGDNGGVGAAFAFTRSGTTWAQQGSKLTGTGIQFGSAVALSGDGNTALVGVSLDASNAGSAFVFTRSGTTWTQQGNKLTSTGETGQDRFGSAVALSGDGNTALIGALGDSNSYGAAFVFTRSGTTWSQQKKLSGSGQTGQSKFGSAVALSSDGNTALIGAPNDSNSYGAAFVFTRSGTTWSQQKKLSGSGQTGQSQFGSAVALSGDGNTALVGTSRDASNAGAAFVFTRSGGVWGQEGSKLTGTGEAGGGQFGYSVALNGDGSTALIGAPNDSNFVGAAFVFTRSGGVWSQQGNKLTGGGETGQGNFGSAVALSGDGSTALIGASGDSSIVGAAFVFTRSGGVWSQQGSKLTGTGETGQGQFGSAVALSSDGNTALIGAFYDNSAVGAAFVFTWSGTTWSQQGSKLTESGVGQFGYSVALSGDGSTALIGVPFDSSVSSIGTAFAFTRSGTTWTQQGSKLTGGGETGQGHFGQSVALSGDGNTALVGAPHDASDAGAAFVFISPFISGISPASDGTAGGNNVILSGAGFGASAANVQVLVGGAPVPAADIASVTDTQIVFRAPAHAAGIVTVRVIVNGAEVLGSATYTYVVVNPLPGSHPQGGPTGSPVALPASRPTGVPQGSPNPLPPPRP